MDARESARQRVWTFDEPDYLFGTGPLRMIVERVDWSQPRMRDGETWFDVQGVEVTADGRVVGPRRTTVKASRLRGPGRR
ncbi:hypothetical protein AB0F81_09695 [Actinoplanes sp. NPDC024001]|uniref:hypothetical protein n=1 Tax=Actinoplanes sp. NPDC024001 TaxID=3154598 RepID=UPI00340BD77B